MLALVIIGCTLLICFVIGRTLDGIGAKLDKVLEEMRRRT